MNSNLRTGDNVKILAGKDKGKTGVIIASDATRGRVTVEGVNIVTKHTKPRSQKDRGGIKKESASIDVSNVQIVCPTCGKTTRIAHKVDENGTKHRLCKKCGAFMDGEKKSRVKKEAKAEKTKVEKAETKEKATKEVAPKKAPAKSTTKATASADKTASTTKRKAPVAKSQGK